MRESVPAEQDLVNHREHVTLQRSHKILEYGLVGHDIDIGRECGLVIGRLKGEDAHDQHLQAISKLHGQ